MEHDSAFRDVVLGRWVDPGEVYARGRALRDDDGPTKHRDVVLATARPSVRDFLKVSNHDRLPELVPLRTGRMLSSPFAFFRGSASLMAGDLAVGHRSGLDAQLCGDAHAGNFGLYGTRDDRIIMDINDFDETATGPWEWDLKRLTVSLVLAGRVGGVSEAGCRDAVQDTVRSYRGTVKHLAQLPFLDAWTALGDESVLDRVKADDLMDDFASTARKARKNTSARIAAKWTRQDGLDWRFVPDPPVLSTVAAATSEAVIGGLVQYANSLHESRAHLLARYSVSDVAFRVVGTGSVGFRNYLILLRGNANEALVLQAKQARPSALSEHLGLSRPEHEGQRIVHGARLVQAETDLFLGFTTIEGRPFIVRQFRNRKGEINASTLDGNHLDDYGRLAGALLARAHSRSLDPRLLAGYCADEERLDTDFATYAVGYANQTESDHRELATAVRDGKLRADIEN